MPDLLLFLQQKKCIEISSVEENISSNITSSNASSESALAYLDFSIRYLSSYAEAKKGIRNSVLGERVEVSDIDSEKVAMSFDWKSVYEEASLLESGMNDLLRELDEKGQMKKLLSNWSAINIDTSADLDSRFVARFVEIPLQNISAFLSSLSEDVQLSEVEEVSRGKKLVRLIVYIDKKENSYLSDLLSQNKGAVVDFPKGSSLHESLSLLESEIKILENKKNSNIIRSQELAKDLDKLKMVYDVYLSQKSLDDAASLAATSEYFSFVEGWVVANDVKLLQYDLENKFSSVCIESLNITSEEELKAPVVIKTSESMKPIQEITNMYGTPASDEIDPTAYYSIFFVIFFGFCLTDAGYGLILMAFTGLALAAKLPFETPVKNMIRLFFYGGLSTFILGVLFGGYFGLTTGQVPEWLTYTRESDGVVMFLGQIFNPMTDLVTKIMPLTYLLGVLHLSLGLYLSGKVEMQKGNMNRMYFVVLPFIGMFISAGLAWGLGVTGLDYVFYGLLLLAIWGLGESGNPIIRILKGLGGMLNELLSWFSNILSYSRLFALGLATGIIGMAFNIVAMTLGGMVPGIGGVLIMVFVLLFGHTLNISLNLLGAYVHASRLQFVEFFGMFLKGGGKRFSPLQKESRYRVLS